MARKKQTKTKTFRVNRDDLAYGIIEEMEKKKVDFSRVIRDLLVSEFSNKKEFEQVKVNRLLNQRKELKRELKELQDKMQKNADALKKLGYEFSKNEI